jgi:hypothetical protein
MRPREYPACHYLMWVPVLCGWSNYLLDTLYTWQLFRSGISAGLKCVEGLSQALSSSRPRATMGGPILHIAVSSRILTTTQFAFGDNASSMSDEERWIRDNPSRSLSSLGILSLKGHNYPETGVYCLLRAWCMFWIVISSRRAHDDEFLIVHPIQNVIIPVSKAIGIII